MSNGCRGRLPGVQPSRCQFAKSFTHGNAERLNNSKVRLEWKVHEPADMDET
eukprot:COSAG03_NODE_136_length_11848_cov_31.778960_12_plen_52_part_00